ncbi:MAG: SDR family oxidoreductase [Planctomycetota bacterium]|nr:SDR family oxidoreductase [Planctomycetota bacterium]
MGAKERFDLTGKTALVTGGSRGIGKGIAVALAEHGADVAIVYHSATPQAQQVADAIKKLGRKAWIFQQDLAKTTELHALADKVWAEAGKVDVLVNNAGIAYLERFNQIPYEHWRHTMAVNLDAPFFLSQRFAERMIAAGIRGRIINLSSKNGFVAEAGLAHYNATKGGLELLTQSLAIELGVHGITVNTIAPGCIETEIGGEFDIDVDKFLKYYYEHVPLEHRFGKVEECVGAVIYLASSAGSYTTGQHIIMDGGVLAEQVPRMQFMKPYSNTIKQGKQP